MYDSRYVCIYSSSYEVNALHEKMSLSEPWCHSHWSKDSSTITLENVVQLGVQIMSTVGDVLFDRSTDNHEEIWDDTELIRAYDRAHQQIQTRLHPTPKTTTSTKGKDTRPVREKKTRKDEVPAACPVPIPMHLISPPKDEQDAFHSMLMAWYMAGFHAGQLAARTRHDTTSS